MITIDELDAAIAECERARPTLQTCEKLAVFYTVKDHITNVDSPFDGYSADSGETLGRYGESPFLVVIEGQRAEDVMKVMNELMTAVSVLHPRLYKKTMDILKGGD